MDFSKHAARGRFGLDRQLESSRSDRQTSCNGVYATVEGDKETRPLGERRFSATLRKLPLMPLVALAVCLSLSNGHGNAAALIGNASAFVPQANRILGIAGFPGVPDDAELLGCYAWDGLTAGVYCAFEPNEGDWETYVARLPRGVGSTDGIPRNLMVPVLPETPWFTPGGIQQGRTWFHDGLRDSARERYRLFVNQETGTCYVYYTWNWLRQPIAPVR